MYVEPIVLFGRKRQQRFAERSLDGPQGLPADLLLFGTLLRLDERIQMLLQHRGR
jgi:hypothetical protein